MKETGCGRYNQCRNLLIYGAYALGNISLLGIESSVSWLTSKQDEPADKHRVRQLVFLTLNIFLSEC